MREIRIGQPDRQIAEEIRRNWDKIAKPLDGLGRSEELICRIGAIQEKVDISINNRTLIVMIADHGIVREGISQSGQEVTGEVASWMGAGESSVCHLAKEAGLRVIPVDVGIASPQTPQGVLVRKIRQGTRDFLHECAMTGEECEKAIEVGMDLAADLKKEGCEIAAVGEMGIGNTTASAALAALLLGLSPREVCGRGAGLSDDGLARKLRVVEEAVRRYADRRKDPFAALCCVGGLEIAAMAGFCIGAAEEKLPVVLDGFISAVAALAASSLAPGTGNYLIASHRGRERGMQPVLAALGLEPVLCADLALGEGTGAAMLFPLLDMALALYRRGKCFADSAVEAYHRWEQP